MKAEYDFRAGVRGKYAKRFAHGTNIVLLEPEVARHFPTTKSVNAALRAVLDMRAALERNGASRRRAR